MEDRLVTEIKLRLEVEERVRVHVFSALTVGLDVVQAVVAVAVKCLHPGCSDVRVGGIVSLGLLHTTISIGFRARHYIVKPTPRRPTSYAVLSRIAMPEFWPIVVCSSTLPLLTIRLHFDKTCNLTWSCCLTLGMPIHAFGNSSVKISTQICKYIERAYWLSSRARLAQGTYVVLRHFRTYGCQPASLAYIRYNTV